jgi:hypothetical protein
MWQTLMMFRRLVALFAACGLSAVGCGRDSRAVPPVDEAPASNGAASKCVHAACGNNYFVDAEQVGKCKLGSSCSIAMTLVAVGAYHINDQYPYKFIADGAQGATFRGTDSAGSNVFSKASHDWVERDERTGVMTLSFVPSDRALKKATGVFKFSVCSAQNCQLEHVPISVPVVIE